MKHLIVKGIGPDKPGIVSQISGMVTSNNGNIETLVSNGTKKTISVGMDSNVTESDISFSSWMINKK